MPVSGTFVIAREISDSIILLIKRPSETLQKFQTAFGNLSGKRQKPILPIPPNLHTPQCPDSPATPVFLPKPRLNVRRLRLRP